MVVVRYDGMDDGQVLLLLLLLLFWSPFAFSGLEKDSNKTIKQGAKPPSRPLLGSLFWQTSFSVGLNLCAPGLTRSLAPAPLLPLLPPPPSPLLLATGGFRSPPTSPNSPATNLPATGPLPLGPIFNFTITNKRPPPPSPPQHTPSLLTTRAPTNCAQFSCHYFPSFRTIQAPSVVFSIFCRGARPTVDYTATFRSLRGSLASRSFLSAARAHKERRQSHRHIPSPKFLP
ncbi:hypothetical protein NLG97_g10649 [Lecanicillium saksenae]|uniref:Uncharacterized protein n=1 Tax=Lecanicillium saksenae TaxID=468837 RepID=A0ACC1QCR9_9HYPO|nr:hypothetical protein NLG97_g10649 [Lecanicillium saksenae]